MQPGERGRGDLRAWGVGGVAALRPCGRSPVPACPPRAGRRGPSGVQGPQSRAAPAGRLEGVREQFVAGFDDVHPDHDVPARVTARVRPYEDDGTGGPCYDAERDGTGEQTGDPAEPARPAPADRRPPRHARGRRQRARRPAPRAPVRPAGRRGRVPPHAPGPAAQGGHRRWWRCPYRRPAPGAAPVRAAAAGRLHGARLRGRPIRRPRGSRRTRRHRRLPATPWHAPLARSVPRRRSASPGAAGAGRAHRTRDTHPTVPAKTEPQKQTSRT